MVFCIATLIASAVGATLHAAEAWSVASAQYERDTDVPVCAMYVNAVSGKWSACACEGDRAYESESVRGTHFLLGKGTKKGIPKTGKY